MDNVDYDQFVNDYGWLFGGAAIAVYLVFLVFAFAQWPVLRERDALRSGHGGGYAPPR
ncbi:hypothetical protein ACNHYB_10055 [Isoptericola jiangsuensis]|uniref:hypothetical protein n=1 Tax=Isoptericola jiangsuensis TaxID=548579 RepID=UPI003AAC4169